MKIQAEHNQILDNSKVIKEKKGQIANLRKEINGLTLKMREKKIRNQA